MESEMRKICSCKKKRHDDLMNLVIHHQQQQSKQMQDFQAMMLTMIATFGEN